MSVQGLPNASQPNLPPSNRPEVGTPVLQRFEVPVFDVFQSMRTKPDIHVSRSDRLFTLLLRPWSVFTRGRQLGNLKEAGEGRMQRMAMYRKVSKSLSRQGRDALHNLMKQGVLNDVNTDDGHSTLYHLYAIATTRRAQGLDNKRVLEETVRILNRPYLITQKFAPLSENIARQMLALRNNPVQRLNRSGSMPVVRRITYEDIDVLNSATCVPASQMYYMADTSPGELARHINEASSPLQAIYEKVALAELDPVNPENALKILKDNGIPYQMSGPGEVMVKIAIPESGMLRAVNASKTPLTGKYRSGVGALIQSAYAYLATKSYDPATDMRDSEVPGQGSKGLTEAEKTLMESIVKDNGGVDSVTYQAVAGKANPAPGEEGLPFLYGYTRSFEQTAGDLIEALKMGEFVIIGITDTDPNGAIVGGHEITVTSAFVDEKDGELKFVVVDSDDDVPAPVVRSARELIPLIHHAGMPRDLAKKIQAEMDATQGYFVPTQEDLASFQPIDFVNEPMPAEAAATGEQASPSVEAAAAPHSAETAAAAKPNVMKQYYPQSPYPPAYTVPPSAYPGMAQAAAGAGYEVEWVPMMSYYPPMPTPYMMSQVPMQPMPQAAYQPPAPYQPGYPQPGYAAPQPQYYPQAG